MARHKDITDLIGVRYDPQGDILTFSFTPQPQPAVAEEAADEVWVRYDLARPPAATKWVSLRGAVFAPKQSPSVAWEIASLPLVARNDGNILADRANPAG